MNSRYFFNKIKDWFFLLKSDPQALVEIRQLTMGLVACTALLYAGESLWLAPKRIEIDQKLLQKKEVESSSPAQQGQILATRAAQLEAEKQELRRQIDILALKVRFAEEQWQSVTDREQFARTVFTLRPNPPVDIEKHLTQMSLLEDRSLDGFTLNMVSLTGEVHFHDLYRYLRYLEARPEISVIKDLTIKRTPAADFGQEARVQFSVLVGRTTLDGSL